jgi:hypothetical protein
LIPARPSAPEFSKSESITADSGRMGATAGLAGREGCQRTSIVGGAIGHRQDNGRTKER